MGQKAQACLPCIPCSGRGGVAQPSRPSRPRVIGLTGGIASGKSTAREILSELGASVIDADKYGHKCYEPGSTCFQEVVSVFGQGIVNPDGTLNRPALGAIVFGDKSKLQQLNKTVWPYIRRMIEADAASHRAGPSGVMVVEAAVMTEAGWLDIFDEVWVVFVPPEVARQRLMQRNNFSAEEAEKRIKAQISNEERLAHANVCLKNDGSTDELKARVRAEWVRLQPLAGIKAAL